uniref:Uncharacterized protein n=1 Tax=Sphaerodactylus townsendi TaxID=933632 RepID=A0ACB8EFS9_9SAUR
MTAVNLTGIDWKWKENTRAHHTHQFRTKELVVRRGEPWTLTLTFRKTKPSDSLTFIVETGATPVLQAQTRVAFTTTQALQYGTWCAVQTSSDANSVTVSISSPANAIIGRYNLSVRAGSGSSAPDTSLGTLVLLFNPWLTGDDVFMPNSAEREEYVLSESGLIFMGSPYYISRIGWNFGQFQAGILDICLAMLDLSKSFRKDAHRDLTRRNDPKHVGRVMSVMVNNISDYDIGVLRGNWSGNYRGGENPTFWTGSVDILRRWKASGYNVVKYGQCWVFAGVLNTVLRCLGMPARVITNFNSAHDTDRNLTVDVYYDESGNPLGRDDDSVWNYHAWNESWFVRSDLGSAYSGWQILDATPQERSAGLFRCGPASLVAIKEGDVDLKYDCPFVFAEVNADCVSWTHNMFTGGKKRLYTETKSVGQFTSTKAVGRYARVDVTDNYKYPEGSAEERKVFEKAWSKMNKNAPAAYPLPLKPSILGKFKVENTPEVGKDIHVALILTNPTSEPKTAEVYMTAWTIVYTGKLIQKIWKNTQSVTLNPKEEKTFPVKITYEDYQQHLTTDNMIHITALCRPQGGDWDTLVERNLMLENPSLTVKVLGQAKVNEAVQVEVLFTNPLAESIKDCVLHVEGSDLLVEKLKLDGRPLEAKQQGAIQFALTPSKAGTKQLLANFSCDKFQHVKAFEILDVAH